MALSVGVTLSSVQDRSQSLGRCRFHKKLYKATQLAEARKTRLGLLGGQKKAAITEKTERHIATVDAWQKGMPECTRNISALPSKH